MRFISGEYARIKIYGKYHNCEVIKVKNNFVTVCFEDRLYLGKVALSKNGNEYAVGSIEVKGDDIIRAPFFVINTITI